MTIQTLPADIRNLSTYYVPSTLFICTAIALILLALSGIILAVTWIFRSCKHIHNYQYMADHEFRVYYNKKEQRIKQDDPDANFAPSQKSDSRDSEYSITTQSSNMEFNRNQSRFLEFMSLSVVVVININAFSCNIFELAAYAAAAILFVLFNVVKRSEEKPILKLLFFVPLIVAYLPFYIENKSLKS